MRLKGKITLYSTGCPRCEVLKKKLRQKGILFTENNDRQEMLDMNFTEVPMLEVNGRYLKFVEANNWINNYKVEE